MLNLSGQAMSSLRSLQQLAPLPVCSRPWSAKHSAKKMQQISQIKSWKLLEWVLGSYIHKMVSISKMQFGFVPGRGTIDAIL